jgi:cell division septation protein DedD
MKKIVTFLSFMSFSALFSQITITANLPSEISANATIETEIKINKGTVGNFAKYQMDVPPGYSVASVDVKGGNFTFENQRAKIVWVSVPSDPEFAIKFKIQASSDAAAEGTFAQKFYYLENNEKKEIEATPIVITIGGGGAVASTPVETVKPVETVVATPVETVKPVEVVKPVETIVSTPVEKVKPVEPTPPPVAAKAKTSNNTSTAGMTFKVQLGAFSSEPSKSRFSKAGSVSIDLVNGLYKVTSGNFNTREEAVKFLNELQGKGFSGFIAKYNNGQRIN